MRGKNIAPMNPSELKSLSQFLSLILRHEPERIGLTLDDAGWAGIDTLLENATASGRQMTRAQLEAVVETSDKKRFAISEDGLRIRANQGHSIDVDLGLLPVAPPAVLPRHGNAFSGVHPGRWLGQAPAPPRTPDQRSCRCTISWPALWGCGGADGGRSAHACRWTRVLPLREWCVADRHGAGALSLRRRLSGWHDSRTQVQSIPSDTCVRST